MESVLRKAFEAFNRQAEPTPGLDSKAWWQQRAVSLEMEARAASDPQAAPLYTITTVNNSTDNMSGYRSAVMEDVRTFDNWPASFSMLRRLNPWLSRVWGMVTSNARDAKLGRKRRLEGEDPDQLAKIKREKTRGAQCEMVLSIIQRQRSMFNTPPLIVLKSMVAFRQGLNMEYWAAECKLRQLMTYKWTKEFVLELSSKGMPMPVPHPDVAFAVYDNCDYHRTKALDRHDDPAEYIKTVNIASVPVPKSLPGLDMRSYSKCHPYLAAWVAPMVALASAIHIFLYDCQTATMD